MSHRKLVVLALTAVVLLGFLMDGMVSADARHIRKRRAATEQAQPQASLTTLMNLIAGTAKGIDPSGRIQGSVAPADAPQLAGGAKALDPSGRIQGSVAPTGSSEMAGGAKMIDPSGRIQG